MTNQQLLRSDQDRLEIKTCTDAFVGFNDQLQRAPDFVTHLLFDDCDHDRDDYYLFRYEC